MMETSWRSPAFSAATVSVLSVKSLWVLRLFIFLRFSSPCCVEVHIYNKPKWFYHVYLPFCSSQKVKSHSELIIPLLTIIILSEVLSKHSILAFYFSNVRCQNFENSTSCSFSRISLVSVKCWRFPRFSQYWYVTFEEAFTDPPVGLMCSLARALAVGVSACRSVLWAVPVVEEGEWSRVPEAGPGWIPARQRHQ